MQYRKQYRRCTYGSGTPAALQPRFGLRKLPEPERQHKRFAARIQQHTQQIQGGHVVQPRRYQCQQQPHHGTEQLYSGRHGTCECPART